MYGYRACRDCGACVQKSSLEAGLHECAQSRYVDYQVMLARRELEHLEDDLSMWLLTPIGRFQHFLATWGA